MVISTFPYADLTDNYDTLTRKILVLGGNESVLVRNASSQDSNSDTSIFTSIRAPQLDLIQELEKLNDPRKISIFADRLVAPSPIIYPPSCNLINLFCRQLDDGSLTLPNPLEVNFDANSISTAMVFRVFCGNVRDLNIRINSPGGSQTITLSTNEKTGGGLFHIQKTNWGVTTSSDVKPPLEFFAYMDLVDQIIDHGQSTSLGFNTCDDNLPRLLRYQLLLAETIQTSRPDVAFSLAAFVMMMSANVPRAYEVYCQATAFASIGALQPGSLELSFVPSVGIKSVENVLQSRLAAASSCEQKFIVFSGQQDSATNVRAVASTAIDAAADAERAYAFLADQSKGQYNAAQAALTSATILFQTLEVQIGPTQQAFKDGIEKWKRQQELKLIADSLVAVVIVVGSIAAAVAVPPAGAAALPAAGAEIAEITVAAGEADKNIGTIAKIINTLKTLFEKMQAALEKIEKVIGAIADMLDVLEKLDAIGSVEDSEITGLELPCTTSTDLINMSANWDIFQIQMAYAYDPIKAEGIDGASDFFLLMDELTIRAQAVLKSQQAVTTSATAYSTALCQRLLAQRQTQRLQKLLGQLQGDPFSLRLFKLSMIDRLLSIRSWVAMDFRQYLQAYSWFALSSSKPITIDVMKEITDLQVDASTLEAAFMQAEIQNNSQIRTFRMSTGQISGSLLITGSWSSDLARSKTITFGIDPSSSMFSSVARIRLRSFDIRLVGAKQIDATTREIDLSVSLGALMTDLLLPSSRVSPSTPSRPQITSATTIDYRGNVYDAEDSFTLMKGEFKDLNSKILGSPFRDWTISVPKSVNVSAVTELQLTIECEVTHV